MPAERYEECEVCQEKYTNEAIWRWMDETPTGSVCKTGCRQTEKDNPNA